MINERGTIHDLSSVRNDDPQDRLLRGGAGDVQQGFRARGFGGATISKDMETCL